MSQKTLIKFVIVLAPMLAASAPARADQLPAKMQGKWCLFEQSPSPYIPASFKRGTSIECEGGVDTNGVEFDYYSFIHGDRFEQHADTNSICAFRKIKQIEHDVYSVHESCKFDNESEITETDSIYQFVNNRLYVWVFEKFKEYGGVNKNSQESTSEAHASETDLIGKWCSAYGEGWKKGDTPLQWGRCTKSALKELLDAEGYAYILAITDKSITINGRKCQRIGTSKWSSGYILKLKCPKGEETWRVSITGKKLKQTLTTDGAEP